VSLQSQLAGFVAAVGAEIKARTAKPLFSATLNSTFQVTSNSFVDVTGWNADILDSAYTFDGVTLTLVEAGRYEIRFTGDTDQYSGNNRSSCYAQVHGNGSLIKGLQSRSYNRQNLHGFGPFVAIRTIEVAAGYQVKIRVRNHAATRLHQLEENGTVFEVEKK